jgi:hypothetical protein
MAIAPIIIQLLATGAPQVSQSVRSVADAAGKAERQRVREAEKAARDRQRIANEEARIKVAAWKKTDAEVRRIQDKAVRDTERAAAAQAKAAEKAAAAQERAIDKAARAKVRIESQAAREVERIQERAHRNAQRVIAREEADKNRAAAQWVKQREREVSADRSSRQRVATAMIGAGAQGVVAGTKRVAGVAAGLAGTAAQLGGGFSIADSIGDEKKLRAQAATLSASTILSRAGQKGEEASGRAYTTNELITTAKAVGVEQGIEPSKVLSAIDTIKSLTGNVEKAVQVVPYVAKLATATGGDVSEMSGLAANILASNQNISQGDLEQQLRVFTRQGVVGGVEVADFAKYGSRLTAGASLFGGDKAENQATMGAFAQISRQYGGASSAAEAAMASQRFATDVAGHSDSLKKQGIDVSDGKGGLRDAKSIIMDMIAKTGGDVTKLKDMGLGDRGVKVLTGASAIYKDAGGGQKGMAALQAEFDKYTKGVSKDEVEAANKRVMGDSGVQLDIAMMKLRATVGEALLPAFLDLVPTITQATPAFVAVLRDAVPPFINLIKALAEFATAHKGIIGDIAAHPIGALMAFEVSKSFASAALPELLRNLAMKSFAPAATGSVLPGSVPGVPSSPANAPKANEAAGGLLAMGVITQAMGLYNVYKDTSGAMAEGRKAGETADAATVEAARNKSGATDVAGAWMERLSTGLSWMSGPGGALIGSGVSSGLDAMGVKSASARSLETLKASELVDAAELQRITTQAIASGIREGVAQGGNSGPNGAGRKDSILDR